MKFIQVWLYFRENPNSAPDYELVECSREYGVTANKMNSCARINEFYSK